MQNDNKIIQDFINATTKQIPSYAWDCTVPIVFYNNNKVQHLGTGTLFRIADYYFLITAAHVFKLANENNLSICIGGAQDGHFIGLKGESIVTSEGQYGSNEDLLDIGIHRLDQDAVSNLQKHKKFLHYDAIDFGNQSPTSIYTLFGFPEVWSTASTSDDEIVKYKALQYTTYQYDRNTSHLSEYQERFHILLDSQIDKSFDFDAILVQPAHLAGNPTSITNNLRGISGCSVWKIGDVTTPFDSWDLEKAKLVAVQIGVYNDSKAIKATRWVAVNTLILNAFPELKSVMKLYF